jgi:hypothetical protein
MVYNREGAYESQVAIEGGGEPRVVSQLSDMDGAAGVVQVVAYITGWLVILALVCYTIRLSQKGVDRSTGWEPVFRS